MTYRTRPGRWQYLRSKTKRAMDEDTGNNATDLGGVGSTALIGKWDSSATCHESRHGRCRSGRHRRQHAGSDRVHQVSRSPQARQDNSYHQPKHYRRLRFRCARRFDVRHFGHVHWRTILQALGVADPAVGVDDVVHVQSDGDIHRTLLGSRLPDVAQSDRHEHEDECRGRPNLDDRSPVHRVVRRPNNGPGARQVSSFVRMAVPCRSPCGRIHADVLQPDYANFCSLVLLHWNAPHSAQEHDHRAPWRLFWIK